MTAETRAGPGSWAVFLDFDGTLVEIAARPEAVIVDPALPDLLGRLRTVCGGALALVTGRSIAVIDGFLPALNLDVCGLHGMERRLSGETMRLRADHLEALRAAVSTLQARLADRPGIIIEDKGESLALHWRLAPEAEPLIRQVAAETVALTGPSFRVQEGKALVEIVPDASGKGRAIESLMADPPFRGRRPLFIGDDVTDENGFRAVNALGGVSIKIGTGKTLAQRRVESPAALRGWLAAFAGGEARPEDLAAS